MRGLVQKPMLGDECMSDGTDPADRNNVLKMLFNEGSGRQVRDLSGNNNKGTLQGTAPGWVSGKHGAAIILPGNNEYVDLGTSVLLNITGDHTIIINMKMFDASGNVGLVSRLLNGGGYPGYTLEFKSAGILRYYNAGCGWQNSSDMGAGYFVGNRHHVAIVVDVDVGGQYYFDGLPSGSWSDSTSAPGPNTGGDAWVGRNYAGVSYTGMEVDHVFIYDRILTTVEIALRSREPFGDLGPRRFLAFAPAAGGISMPVVMLQHNHFNGGMAA